MGTPALVDTLDVLPNGLQTFAQSNSVDGPNRNGSDAPDTIYPRFLWRGIIHYIEIGKHYWNLFLAVLS